MRTGLTFADALTQSRAGLRLEVTHAAASERILEWHTVNISKQCSRVQAAFARRSARLNSTENAVTGSFKFARVDD
jgi:hypothetical protein